MPRRWRVPSAVLLAVASAVAGCTATPPPPPDPVARGDEAAVVRQATAFIRDEMARHRIAGLSIALVDAERIVWAEGFGVADARTARPATAHTLYRMGSISKPVTAAAALRLMGEGRLALDAPVSDRLPGFEVRSAWSPVRPITLRDLLAHQSGLPRDHVAGMWPRHPPGTSADFRALVRERLADAEAGAPPGIAMAYSNLGYNVVGALIEAASGEA
jgi:CubicO group peptidase (beta-lactamase class C family)